MTRADLEHEVGERAHISDFKAKMALQAFEDIVFEAIASNDMITMKYFKIGGIVLPPHRAYGYGSLWYEDCYPARSGYPAVIFSPKALETVDIPAEEYFKEHANDWDSDFRVSLLSRIYYHNYGLNKRLKDTMKYIVKVREVVDRMDARFRLTLTKLKKEEDREKWATIFDDIAETERKRTFYLGLKMDRAVARKMWLREDYWEWQEKKLYGKWPNNDDFGAYLNEKYKGTEEMNLWEQQRAKDRDYLNRIISFEDVYEQSKMYMNDLAENNYQFTKNDKPLFDTKNADEVSKRQYILDRIHSFGITDEEVEAARNEGMDIDELYYNMVMSQDFNSEDDLLDEELEDKMEDDESLEIDL